MATQKQIAANRANARKSTGPRTTAGKARAARNAFTLGLTTTQLLAPSESRAALDRHAAELREHLAPRNPIEDLLADRIIAASWRLRRARIMETRIFHQRVKELEPCADHTENRNDVLAEAYRCTIEENSLQRLSLEEARLERSLYRALKTWSVLRENKNRQIEPNSNSAQPLETAHNPQKSTVSAPDPLEPNPTPIRMSVTLAQAPPVVAGATTVQH